MVITTTRFIVFALAAHLLVAVAPYFAPYSPSEQHRSYPLAPPTKWQVSLSDGIRACATVPTERFGEYRHDCTANHDAARKIFLMGTDELGRDVASQFLAGARHSLFAAEAAALLSLLIAVLAGTAGGYLGGAVDRLTLRLGDIVLALPWLYAILAVRGALPLSVGGDTVTILTILLLAVVGWVRPARVFRAIVASTRGQGFVLAATGFGAPPAAIIRRHLLPPIAGAALTQAALLVPKFLLAEVALSVLGVLGESAGGWGPLVAVLQRYAIVSSAWWLTLPALLIVVFFILVHKLADAMHASLRAVPQRG